MCYHNSIAAGKIAIEKRYKAVFDEQVQHEPNAHEKGFDFRARPIITAESPGQIKLYHWGLIPSWTKSSVEAHKIRSYTLNAKAETIYEKPSFRSAIKTRRCLILSTGFFEWQEVNKKKIPYFIQLTTNDIFSMGGIYEEWIDHTSGEIVSSYSIITTAANSIMEEIHNVKKRMPLIFNRENEQKWLDLTLQPAEIKALMVPYPTHEMELIFKVSKV